MPNTYITDEAREKLDKLVDLETRTLSDEILFLCNERLKVLNVPESATPSGENNDNTNNRETSQA